MKPVLYAAVVLCVIVLLAPWDWFNARSAASSVVVADGGVVQVVIAPGINTTETFTIAPEWVERGVRELVITDKDYPEPIELAKMMINIPDLKVVAWSTHLKGSRVDRVTIFFTLDPDYVPPPVGFREDGSQKSIRDLIDEMAK